LGLLRWRGAKTWQLAITLGALLLSGARAKGAIEEAAVSHASTVALLTPPSRCESIAVVERSPVVLRRELERHGEEGRGDVRVLSGRCGEQTIAAPFIARVYGAPETLVRGDRVELVADLG